MILYRFTVVYNSEFENAGLKLNQYKVETETPRGYWLYVRWINNHYRRRWVSNYTKKRWAYPTKDEALVNFIKRTEIRIALLNVQIENCNVAMMEADEYYK